MKLLYSGASACDEVTLKRLLLVGTELVFMDRPSVTFAGKWGTIGHESPFRRIDTSGQPVTISVYAPPSGPATGLYESYARADFDTPQFARTFLEGLQDPMFAAKFVQAQANYGEGVKGQTIVNALAADQELTPLPLGDESDPRGIFRVDTIDQRRATLRMVLTDASIQLTSALIIADEAQAIPIANDRHLLKLLSMRTSDPRYVGNSAPHSWLIGLEFAKAVIPDEGLQRLKISEILDYRRKSIDVYRAWTAELNAIAAQMDDLSIAEAQERIPKLIATELEPKLVQYRSEMASIRDSLFSDLVKGITNWKVPALSFGSMAAMGYTAAVTAFASSAVAMLASPTVDYFKSRRAANRKHAVSFLVGLSDADH